MIPNFALSLSFDGIGLLRRTGSRWALVEEVGIEDPDLDSAVAGLRARAIALDPRGAQVLLIIPNEQIRYLDLPDLGGDDAARDAAIRVAMDGATPYAVADLTHDHAVSGGRLQIAAVANETLVEAERFAETHGFTPVAFAAIAPAGAFDGAVFFGRAASWRRTAERPSRAIEVVPATEAALRPLPRPTDQAPDGASPANGGTQAAPAPQVDAPVPGTDDDSPAETTTDRRDAPSASPEPAEPAFGAPSAASEIAAYETEQLSEAPEIAAPAAPAPEIAASASEAPVAWSDAPTAGDDALPVRPRPSRTMAEAPHTGSVNGGTRDGAAAPREAEMPSQAAAGKADQPLDLTKHRKSEDEALAPSVEPGLPQGTGGRTDQPLDLTKHRKSEDDALAPSAEPRPSQGSADPVEQPADLAPLPDMPPPLSDDAAQGSFAFASVRARRDDAIPPAPRPLKLGPEAGSAQRPRFSPLAAPKAASARHANAARGAGSTAEAGALRRDPPLSSPAPDRAAPAQGVPGATDGPANRIVKAAPGAAPAVSVDGAMPAVPPAPLSGTKPVDDQPRPALTAKVLPSDPATDAPALGGAEAPAPSRAAPAVRRPAPATEAAVPPVNPAAKAWPEAPDGAAPLSAGGKAREAANAGAKQAARSKAPAPAHKPSAPRAGTAAPAPAAQAAPARAPAPGAAATTPLARLAALRAQGLPSPAAPAVGAPAAAGVLPADGHRFAAPKQAARTLTSSADERERMTVFGARNNDRIGGKPRFLGLMLTAALLIFLAGVAAWASVFLDEGLARLFRSPEPETQVASLPAEVDPEPETATPPDTPPQAASSEDLQLAALDPSTETPEREATFDVVPAPEPATEALSQPVVPRALSPEEAAATYAATGIWQRAPAPPLTPPDEGVEDVYVASIDPDVESSDAIALPAALSPTDEPVLEEPGLPPPAGMTFDIDDRGLVRATPEGALTPDGLRIFAGLPPAVPPLRSPPEAEPDSEAPEAEPPVVDRLEQFRDLRPRARPSDVIEQRERATLQGISRSELAAFRPVSRPVSVQEEAAAAEEPETPATAQAVLASPAPVLRPGNFAAIVQRAERTPQPEAEAAPVQTAAVAPRTVSPAVPSSASVAKSATVRNAINLGKINLIGVYGTPNNRRALVRLSNGKYQKVKVGDRLDGGRVSAIGDADLRYTKGNRNLTLQMPSG